MVKNPIYRNDQLDTTEPLAVDAERAAKLLSLSSKTVRSLAKAGKLPSKRVGHRVLFSVEALRQFVNDTSAIESALSDNNVA